MKAHKHLAPICLAALVGLTGCESQDTAQLRSALKTHDAVLQELPRQFYAPGLGDMMHTLQLRHAKLWFAGKAGNWALAQFELHELEESFEAIAQWHPAQEGLPVAAAIKVHMQPGRYALEQAIATSDGPRFDTAFERFTQGCNDCHRALRHAFIVIERPTMEPVTNQRWETG